MYRLDYPHPAFKAAMLSLAPYITKDLSYKSEEDVAMYLISIGLKHLYGTITFYSRYQCYNGIEFQNESDYVWFLLKFGTNNGINI